MENKTGDVEARVEKKGGACSVCVNHRDSFIVLRVFARKSAKHPSLYH